MASITEFSIHNSRFSFFTIILVCILGILIFLQYPSREDPSIVIRQAQVTSHFEGMSPEHIEDLITKPIEQKLREISAIENIISDSKTGVSLIKIEVRDSINANTLDDVWQEIRTKMTDVSRQLPSGTAGPIVNDEVGLTAIASISLSGEGFSFAEQKKYIDDLRDELYELKGTEKITTFGVQEERIFLEFSTSILSQLGIEPSLIFQTLKSQNIILPGGKINADGIDVILEPSGSFTSIEDIENVLIAVPNSVQLIRLDDIVKISRDYITPPKSPVYFNDSPALVIGVSILDGINSIEYGERLKQKVDEYQSNLPWGLNVNFVTFQPELVKTAVSGAINNLYQTIVIVLLVVILSLGFRSGLIVGSFVPVTMLASIAIMYFFDVELQRMSIAAMIISLGMLVDNGIVIVESISVKMAKGMSRADAAISSGKSLAIPLLTSTLTTILFFVPIAMAEGGVGEYTMSLAQVITIVLLVSWFFSLYITPMLGSHFLKINKNIDVKEDRLSKEYLKVLHLILRFKVRFIVLILFTLVGSGYLLTTVDKEFFPLGDRNQFVVLIDLSAGSSITQTDEVVQRISGWLTNKEINPEIESSVSYVASGGPRFFLSLSPPDPDPHKAFILINTQKSSQVDTVLSRVKAQLLERYPEVRADVKKMWMGASEAGLFELRITSNDADVLFEQGERVTSALNAIPNMSIVKHDWENKIIKLKINIDQALARQVGISSEEIANVLSAYLDGVIIGDYREGENVIPIVVQGQVDERNAISALSNLNIYSKSLQKTIPLQQISSIDGSWQFGRIKRYNQERTLSIKAKHNTLTAEQILEELTPTLDNMSGNFTLTVAGEIEQQTKANTQIFANFPYAVGIIVLLLIWQFNSYRKTAIILLTIPLVLVGATLGLIIMDALFGFMVILGFFSLAGIIINNGIVLIDQISTEEAISDDRYQALINACSSRLRPILITTLTTVLGLMPLILSNDALFYGMASAIAFGLAVGSLMTLGFVPALYALFYSIKRA